VENRDRQELAQQFAQDVARMQRCLQDAGKHLTEDDIVSAWADYSISLGVEWMMPPEEDEAMLKILLQHQPPFHARWETTILDAGDGSGDGILELPDELCSQMGWKEGDTLSLTLGKSSELIFRRTD